MKKISRLLFLLFLLLLTRQTSFGQTAVNDSLNLIIAEMDSSNTYEMSYTVGFAGRVSQQYLRMQKIAEMASAQELNNLAASHQNAVVRLYALRAIKFIKYPVPEIIVQRFLNDHSKVTVLNGCFGGSKKVSTLAKDILENNGKAANQIIKM
jgi:hypothetical protein